MDASQTGGGTGVGVELVGAGVVALGVVEVESSVAGCAG